MSRILSASLCLFAVGALCAEAAAPAGEHANQRANLGEGRGERHEKCLAHLKADHPEVFARIDANGDGDINGGEFQAFLEKKESALKEKHPDLFAAVDADGNGDLSKEELKVAREMREERFKAKHPEAFDKIDRNDDGKIDHREADKAREKRDERRTNRSER